MSSNPLDALVSGALPVGSTASAAFACDGLMGPIIDKARLGDFHEHSGTNAIVILAAGGSRRLGQPKQLVQFNGKSLVRIATENALATGSARVLVVVGADADSVRAELHGAPIEWVGNEIWEEGIASSIRAAISHLERGGPVVQTLLLMLCDQPGVSSDLLRRLLHVHHVTRAPVTACRYPDGPGVPALFEASLFAQLKTLQGDVGAKQFIRRLPFGVVTVPFDKLEDVDTLDDLRTRGQNCSIAVTIPV